MIDTKPAKRVPHTSYYENTAILLQLILQEANNAVKMIQEITTANKEYLSPEINKLISPTLHPLRLFSFRPHENPLAKLERYTLFFKKSSARSSQTEALHALCIKMQEQVLTGAYNALKLFSEKFTNTLMQIIFSFKSDENIIFYLLCHNTSLTPLFGKRGVYKLLFKLYPSGVAELEKFLIDHYTARQFHHLIPIISEKLNALKLKSSPPSRKG